MRNRPTRFELTSDAGEVLIVTNPTDVHLAHKRDAIAKVIRRALPGHDAATMKRRWGFERGTIRRLPKAGNSN